MTNLVEGTVESDFKRRGELDDVTGAESVDSTVGSEKPHYDGSGAVVAGKDYLAANLVKFVVGIAEIAIARTNQHMGAEVERTDAIVDVAGLRGKSADFKIAAKLNATSTSMSGISR